MGINKIKLVFRTIKYLKAKQICYRIYYLIRDKVYRKKYHSNKKVHAHLIQWKNYIESNHSYIPHSTFSFLNIQHVFHQKIDWNYAEYGKLWTYNLNYFDFLLQKEISKEQGLNLIQQYLEDESKLKDGLEPYPISLRGINWIKFLSIHKIQNDSINQALYKHYLRLIDNTEYHILGNHLLENGFSLLFAAYYFKNDLFYRRAKKILIAELEEQILEDGGHFELSPMYHQILFFRLLDCVNLVESSPWKEKELLGFLKEKASFMWSWLRVITYQNGDIPMVNDATCHIAPTTNDLHDYAEKLGVKKIDISLKSSGYRKIEKDNYELLVDIGVVGPDYQPGHAHSDTFSFEIHKERLPIIVDTGITTYEKNKIRNTERSTCSHNTVEINGENQTEVWGGFRVGRRARVFDVKEEVNSISATHNGYKRFNAFHTREFITGGVKEILIKDSISRATKNTAKAYFHFHYKITEPKISNEKVLLEGENVILEFKGASDIQSDNYELSLGFNKKVKAHKIIVTFDQNLETTISL